MDFNEARKHIGHVLSLEQYGKPGDPVSVTLMCVDCNEILDHANCETIEKMVREGDCNGKAMSGECRG